MNILHQLNPALIIALVFSFVLPKASFSQFWLPTKDKAALIEGRTLLVETEDFVCNQNMVDHLKKHWKLNTEIKGMTANEITALLTPENARKYLVLTGDEREETRSSKGKYEFGKTISIVLYPGENAGRRNDINIDREWICKMALPSCLVAEEEVLFFSQQMALQVQMVQGHTASSNRKKMVINKDLTLSLKDKTLLLDKETTSTSPNEFSKYYSGKAELVDRSVIKNAINNKEAGKVYLSIIWNDKAFKWYIVAIDCQTGNILASCKVDGFKPNLMKKKFDASTQFLPLYRAKYSVGLMPIKYLGKAITKAEMTR